MTVAAREMVVIVEILFGGLNLKVWSAIAVGIMDGEDVKALSPMSEAAIIMRRHVNLAPQFRNLALCAYGRRGEGRMLRARECRLCGGISVTRTRGRENLLLGVI